MPLSQLLESRCRDLQAELADARRTIDTLRHSEEKFRRILANMPDVTWTSDQYGRMTYLSPRVEGLFGYSSEEVRASGGDLWLGRVHPDDSGRVLQAYWALFENRSTFDEEYRIQRKDGTWIWVHDRAIRTHEKNGVLYADGIFCDVTARKLAEEELRSKTAFLEAQANSTIDGILVVDDHGQRILQNQKFVEMFGIPSDIAADPDDRRALGFVVSVVKDAESFLARVQYLYRHPNETSRDEIEFKNGTILDRYSSPVVDKNGKHYGRIWTFRDITERKRNEDMLQQLSMAVEQSAVSVVITDPQGNISYVNRKFTEVTGYTTDEVVGKNPRVLNSGRCAPETYKELWSAITQGREWRGEFCNRRKSGDIFWEAATITPIIDPKGLITHFLAIKEDITERRVLESQLRQAQKLEGIGQLAAGIAHEINTPTQFVTDNLTFLRDSWKAVCELLERYRAAIHDANGKLPPGVASALEQAERNCDLDFIAAEVPRAIDQGLDGARRVAKIVRAMKEFSHPDSADKIATDLNQAIESTITVARNEWKYVAAISTQFGEDLPPVVCYAGGDQSGHPESGGERGPFHQGEGKGRRKRKHHGSHADSRGVRRNLDHRHRHRNSGRDPFPSV